MYTAVDSLSFPLDVLSSTPVFVTDMEVFSVYVETKERSHWDSEIVVILLTLSSVLASSDGTCTLTALVAFIGMCAEEWVCAMETDGVYSVGDIFWLLAAYTVGNTLRLLVAYVRDVVRIEIGAVSASDPPAIAPVHQNNRARTKARGLQIDNYLVDLTLTHNSIQ